jgi:short-subunit dehydrogenase
MRQTPLRDQVALVTGASSGIGAETARELGRRGAAVVLAARRADKLEAQARRIRQAGGRAVAIPTDVTELGQLNALTQGAEAAFGRVDVVVNNAGAGWLSSVADSPPEQLDAVVKVNLVSAMLLTRAVLPGMLSRCRGAIIFVGSLSGRVAMEPVYSATKYGVRGFALALRRQLAGTGVSVSLVSPGNIATAMTSHVAAPMPGPELVAKTIADLVDHPRREVVVPRRHYAIAWLEQALPTMADVVHRRRHWSPVPQEEVTVWTS